MDPKHRKLRPAPPRNEIPAVVPTRLVLAHTESIVLWMTDMRVYSTELTFVLEARQRNGRQFLGMYGFGKPEAGSTPPMLFGIEDSAGTISTNLPKTRSGLHPRGGEGNTTGRTQGYWLAPLPAPGPMSIHIAWPHFDIAESRIDIDANIFHEAAADIVTLWPPKDAIPGYADIHDRTVPQIDIPSGGWFEKASASQTVPPTDPDGPRRINFGSVG